MSGPALSGCPKEECRKHTLLVMPGCRSVTVSAVTMFPFVAVKAQGPCNITFFIVSSSQVATLTITKIKTSFFLRCRKTGVQVIAPWILS